MVILLNEENEETNEFEFSECSKEKVIVQGLEDDCYIISEVPYYYQDEDGYMIGLNDSFTELKVMNSENEIIQIIHLNWINRCTNENESQIIEETEISFNQNHSQYLSWIGLIFIFVVLVFFQRRNVQHD